MLQFKTIVKQWKERERRKKKRRWYIYPIKAREIIFFND